MQRTDLSLAVLQLKALGIENIVRFEFPSAPPAKNLVIKTSRGPLLIFHETKLVKKIRRHTRLQIIIIIGFFTDRFDGITLRAWRHRRSRPVDERSRRADVRISCSSNTLKNASHLRTVQVRSVAFVQRYLLEIIKRG